MVEPTSVFASIKSVAVKAGASRLFESLIKSLTGRLGTRRTGRALERLDRHLVTLSTVKPLWHRHEGLSLEAIYHPLCVREGSGTKTLWSLGDIGDPPRLIITGAVGQGKSMLMRALASTEFSRGERFPLFVEFRKLPQSETLLAALLAQLTTLGLPVQDLDAFENLAKKKALIIFLDGFDELSTDSRRDRVAEIEQLCDLLPNIRIVLSSRPNPVQGMPAFTVRELAPLSNPEIRSYAARVLNLMGHSDTQHLPGKFPDDLPSSIQELLRRPLFLDLYLFRVVCKQKPPEHEHEFFRGLFVLLASQHDHEAKPGYRGHERLSGLDDLELYRLYCRLCYDTTATRTVSIDTLDLLDLTKSAMTELQLDGKEQDALEDIVECTGLIFKTEGQYEFIHPAQEFHTAEHIAKLRSADKPLSYARMREDFLSDHLIRHLRTLDPTGFSEHYELPLWQEALKQSHVEDNSEYDGIRLFQDDMYFLQLRAGGSLYASNNGISMLRHLYGIIIEGRPGGDFWNESETVDTLLNTEKILADWSTLPAINPSHPDTKMVRLSTLAQHRMLTHTCIQRYTNIRLVIECRVAEIMTAQRRGST